MDCMDTCQAIGVCLKFTHRYQPRSSFVALFSARLGCWLLFEISFRKSSSWPKRLLFAVCLYDFPGFISCCITMLHIQHHPILFQLNFLVWAIDKTKWCNDKWLQIDRVNHHLPSIHHKRIKPKREVRAYKNLQNCFKKLLNDYTLKPSNAFKSQKTRSLCFLNVLDNMKKNQKIWAFWICFA